MRVLLTGSSGQIGSILKLLLAPYGEIIAPSREAFNLSRFKKLDGILESLAPTVIVNCAAFTAVDQAEADVELAFAVNAEAPGALAEWGAKRHVPIIHFSTDYVFNGNGTRPWSEVDRTDPLSAYGRSKLMGELAIQKSGVPYLIVRTSWIYDARSQKNFMRAIIRRAFQDKELRVVSDQVGAPTSAEVVASTVAHLIDMHRGSLSTLFEKAGGMCHIACSGAASWYGFASAILDGMRCRGLKPECQTVHAITSSEYPTKAIRPLNSRLSLERLAQEFGVRTPHWHAALDVELDRYITTNPLC